LTAQSKGRQTRVCTNSSNSTVIIGLLVVHTTSMCPTQAKVILKKACKQHSDSQLCTMSHWALGYLHLGSCSWKEGLRERKLQDLEDSDNDVPEHAMIPDVWIPIC
jgi:hypothetical protein